MRVFYAMALTVWAATGFAQTADAPQNGLAQDGIAATIAQLSVDPATHGFEIGMLQTLRAVEKTLQARYDYGLGDRVRGLMLLRLGTGGMENLMPKQSTPETLATIIDGFVTDVAIARTTLAVSETDGVQPFTMVLQDIWFDINANGTREDTEAAFAILGPVILGARGYRDMVKSGDEIPPLMVRFDYADHAWLMAYTNMLSSFGNLFMAFDPTPVLRDLAEKRTALQNAPEIPNLYDHETIQANIVELEAELEALSNRATGIIDLMKPLRAKRSEIRKEMRLANDEASKSVLKEEILRVESEMAPLKEEEWQIRSTKRLISNEIRAARLKLPEGSSSLQNQLAMESTTIDALYVAIKSLAQQPDPDRVSTAYEDLRAMIHHNRVFWERLSKETDNDHEWIPNAAQDSALPFALPPRLAEGWQEILKDVEDTLDGRLLVFHPLLPKGYGISLPAYVDDPSALDIVDWVHGIGAYKYAAKGPRLTG